MGDAIDATQVAATIEMLRPAIRLDGGDIVLRDVDTSNGVVRVELHGACGGCGSSSATLHAGVRRIVMDRVAGVTALELWRGESETAVDL